MKFSSSHLKRYKDIARLLWKYGRSDLAAHLGDEAALAAHEVPPEGATTTPEMLADDLEAMGPTYVKFGQVLAGRPGLLPETYLTALARLQDRVKPFPYPEVERIVGQELGARISKAFSFFDPMPLAAASLGQVHRATLRDGREVVVKVQRPDVRRQITEDFEVLEQIANFLDEHTATGKRYRFRTVLEEFRSTIRQELNYEREAQNLRQMGANLAEFELLQIPQPIDDYTTSMVLTMEYVRGAKVTALSPLARLELNGAVLCDVLFRAYLKQVLVDGLFHADPHPGNVFITDDGRVALLDLGMVGHTSPGMQDRLLKLVLAVSEGHGEEAANTVIEMGEKAESFDAPEFRRRIAKLVATRRDQPLQELKVGQSLLDVSARAVESGLFVPSELTLLGKTLLQLDQVGRILEPNFNPNESIQKHAAELMTQRVKRDFSQGNFFASVLELKHFVGGLPNRLNRIMDSVADAQLEVKVRSTDAPTFLTGLQKIANRITTGLVLAALIVGAALMMRIETSFRLFGYPGLAILCFLAAAAGGAWLVVSAIWSDIKDRRHPPRQ